MNKYIASLILVVLIVSSCKEPSGPSEDPAGDLTDIPYNPVAYDLVVPDGYPEMEIPADNPMTVDGVELGRFLFWDPILSADNSMSCGSCHFPAGGFTDTLPVSVGIDGIPGRRSSMALMNVGYFYEGLFWDGRSTTLEEQALLPVEDPIELHNQWPNVVQKFKDHSFYPEMFRKAFGIDNTSDITKELAAKAIAQFERSMVSSGQSKYDRQRTEAGVFFTPEEAEGFELFRNELGMHPGCTHCHSSNNHLFTNDEYHNNRIDSVGPDYEDLVNFEDWGLGEVTGDQFDNGKFRVPSLLNIMVTQPYMHDGRFQTMSEVLDHYSSGGFPAFNDSPDQTPFPLSEDEKEKLIIFLETLTDHEFLNNEAYSDPFN